MYILRNVRNRDAQEGVAMPGDIIVSADFNKSYLVGEDQSHRRLSGGQHAEAIAKARQELRDLPVRRARQQNLLNLIKRQLEG